MLSQILKKNYFNQAKVKMYQNNNRKPKNFPQFTHFVSIPFIKQQHRQTLGYFQDRIQQIFTQNELHHTLKRTNTDLMHVTLGMLTLNLQQHRDKTVEIVKSIEKQIFYHLKGMTLTLGDIKYFTRYDKKERKEYVRLFYFDIIEDENIKKLEKATDLLVRQMIKAQIIDSNELKSMHIKYDHRIGMYVNEAYHMTLFRIEGLSHDHEFKDVFKSVEEIKNEKDKMEFVMDCDFIDISTRGHFDGTNFYMPLCRVQLTNNQQKPLEEKQGKQGKSEKQGKQGNSEKQEKQEKWEKQEK